MSKSKVFENDFLKLVFHGEPIAGIAGTPTVPLTNLYLALHTKDPGETGDQSTDEVAFTGYSRVPVARDSSGWTISSNVASPAQDIEFGEMTGGTEGIATHITIGTHPTGAGKVLFRGRLNPQVNYVIGSIARIRSTSTITED